MKILYCAWLLICMAGCALFGSAQEAQYRNTLPLPTNTKASSVNVCSNGDVVFTDPDKSLVYRYAPNGLLREMRSVFSTQSGDFTLKEPVFVNASPNGEVLVYDKGLGKLFCQPTSGKAIAIGKKGSNPGEFSTVADAVADSKGYVFVLESEKKAIYIFDAKGQYISAITGAHKAFEKPRGIGINAADELYVLDTADEPIVYIFDVYGNVVNVNRNLNKKQGSLAGKATDIGVFADGSFSLMNPETNEVHVYNRLGDPLLKFGSKGIHSPGVFSEVTAISGCGSGYFGVYEEKARNVQIFQVTTALPVLLPAAKRLRLEPYTATQAASYDLFVSPAGLRYAIPLNIKEAVNVYLDTTAELIYSFRGGLKEAMAVAVNNEAQAFVVDRNLKEIFVFDAKGNVIRRFGKDIPEKLKDPSGIAIQSDGTVLVCDKSRGCVHAWSANGVYQKMITSSENSTLKEPQKIQVDSKNQLYIWDISENCIYKIGSSGWPTSPKKLYAKSERVGDKPGEIKGFIVDAQDLIHLYNATTGQLEVYSWDTEPVQEFSIGHKGDGTFSFGKVETLTMDKEHLVLHFSSEAEKQARSYRFIIPPPPPTGDLTFDVFDGQLVVYFKNLQQRSVTGYGLVLPLEGGRDTVVARSPHSPLTVAEDLRASAELRHYGLVSFSQTDVSVTHPGFDDYFNYGKDLLKAGRFEEALPMFDEALISMTGTTRMKEYVAELMVRYSEQLIDQFDPERAVKLMRYALKVTPENDVAKLAYSKALSSYLELWVNKSETARAIAEVQSSIQEQALKPLTIAAMVQLSDRLIEESIERRVADGVLLLQKAKEWDADNKSLNGELCEAFWKSFLNKAAAGRSVNELKADLRESIRNGKIAYEGLKPKRLPYYAFQLTLMDALIALDMSDETEAYAVGELAASAAMPDSIRKSYRIRLARAFETQSKFTAAADEYRRLLKDYPEDTELMLEAGFSMLTAGEGDVAKGIFQNILIKDRNAAGALAGVGLAELKMGNYAEASFQLEKALRLDPSESTWNIGLAEAFDKMGSVQKAIDHYELAVAAIAQPLAIDPKEAASDRVATERKATLEKLRERLAELYAQTGASDKSVLLWQSIVNDDPGNARALAGLGSANLVLGRIYDAIAAYQRAVNLEPGNADYSLALNNSIKSREKLSKNSPALAILELKVDGIYPSLIRNYADQRYLPVGELVVANNTPDPITPTSLQVFVPEFMSQPTEVRVPALIGYSNARIKLTALFNRSVLENASERKSQLQVELNYTLDGASQSVKKSESFTLYGRNAITWTDKRRLAAFVSNNEERWIQYIKKMEVVFRDAPTHGLNKPMLKAAQLYTLLQYSNIRYSEDPSQSYAAATLQAGMMDYLQYPAETFARKGGDCDDLTTLFAALLENAGIPAAYVDVPGHVFVAFDTKVKPDQLEAAGLSAEDVVIAYDRVWIPVEMTVLGTRGFTAAWTMAVSRYKKELRQGHFPEIVPLADAWSVYLPDSYFPPDMPAFDQLDVGLFDEYNKQLAQIIANTRKEAIREIERRYVAEPANVYVKNRYATYLAQIGELALALRILSEAAELAPQSPVVLNNMGNVYFLQKDYEKAIEYYTLASEIDESDAGILINLCKSYLAKGDKEKAGNCYRKVETLNQEMAQLYEDLKNQIR